MTDWPAQALAVLQEASGHTVEDAALIMQGIRERGWVLVPLRTIPDEAVGEVMSWTHCDDPQMAWEGINCALNWIGLETPDHVDLLRKLGSGDMTLSEYWNAVEQRRR